MRLKRPSLSAEETASVSRDPYWVTVGLSSLTVSLLCLPELWLRHGGSKLLGLLLALLLGGAIGTLLSLLALHNQSYKRAAVLLLVPVPLLHVRTIYWAISRASDLSYPLRSLAVWTLLLAIAAITTKLCWIVTKRYQVRSPIAAFLSLSLGLLSLFIALVPAEDFGDTLGIVVPSLFIMGGFALVLYGWRRHLTLALLALGTLAITYVIPTRYIELKTIMGWTSASSLILNLAFWNSSTRVVRANKKTARSVAVAMLAASSLLAAHFLISRRPASWAAARGAGMLSVFVETGHRLTDFDGDGASAIFAQSDCHPFDGSAHPGAYELPGNDVDENCLAGPVRGDTAAWVKQHEAINLPPSPWQGDIIFVVIDTLRADDATAPELSAISSLRSRGIDFTNAYASSSFTSFSLQSLLGGRIPGALKMRWEGRLSGVPAHFPKSLASQLQRLAGYDTALAGGARKDQNPYFQPLTFGQGFRITERLRMDARPSEVVQAAHRAWQRMDESKPRFLYLHIMWLHEVQQDRAAYRQSLREVDGALEQILQRIGTNAMWILTADHGEEFGEHGGRHHASTLYQEQIRVPLIMAIPGGLHKTESHVAPLRSLLPTLLTLVAPEHSPKGLGPYLCIDQSLCNDLPVPLSLPMQDLNLHGLLLGDRKIIRDNRRGTLEAFELGVDPAERRPLTGDQIPRDLEQALLGWEENAFGPRSESHVWPYHK